MAAQRRKKVTKRRGASRGRRTSSPGYLWFFSGLLAGLAISGFMFFKGYLPDRSDKTPVPDTVERPSEEQIADETESIAGENNDRRFDFFTVLPEMEVLVPDQELSRDLQPPDSTTESSGTYILQVASFRNPGDAEQMKARLALLGSVANIQVVTINEATWHRVRIGPIQGARPTDEIRRMLQDNGIKTMLLKGNP